MGHIKYSSIQNEYSGESLTKTLSKKDGSIWDATDTATYELLDNNGIVKSSGALDKSVDNKSMTLVVPSTDTVDLFGTYKLLVTLANSSDARINDVIAEYKITYNRRKA